MTYEFAVDAPIPEDAFEWAATWHCFLDACPVCQNLNGYPFSGIGFPPDLLMHPQWGPVWDLRGNLSLTHPNCRCSIELRTLINWGKIPEFAELSSVLEESLHESIEWGTTEEVWDISQLEQARQGVMTLKTETTKTAGSLQEMEYIFYRLTSIMHRMGLPPEAELSIQVLQRMILTIKMLTTSILLLEASTPMGAVKGLISLAGTGLAAIATSEMITGGYDKLQRDKLEGY